MQTIHYRPYISTSQMFLLVNYISSNEKGYYYVLFIIKVDNIGAQSAGAREYTDCIFAEGLDSPKEYPIYDTKPSDGEAPVMLEL